MHKRKQKPTYSPERTVIAFGISRLVCAGIAYVLKTTYDSMIDIRRKLPGLPGWHAHTDCVSGDRDECSGPVLNSSFGNSSTVNDFAAGLNILEMRAKSAWHGTERRARKEL